MLFDFGLSVIKTLSKIVSPNGSSKHPEQFIMASFLSVSIFFTDSAVRLGLQFVMPFQRGDPRAIKFGFWKEQADCTKWGD